jgi:hypothetical protein
MAKTKSLRKPRAKTVKRLDYSASMAYLEKKYGFKARDYADRHGAGGKDKPYLDFWHWIVETKQVHNGCDVTFTKEDLSHAAQKQDNDKSPDTSWRVKIVEYILKEFGKGRDREVTFWVQW